MQIYPITRFFLRFHERSEESLIGGDDFFPEKSSKFVTIKFEFWFLKFLLKEGKLLFWTAKA